MATRKVAAIDGSGRIVLLEEPVPTPGPGEVLIEVRASVISPGTELGGVPARRREPNPTAPPRPFGYSNAGVVLATGPGCEGIAPGTAVACMGGGYALHATHAVVPRNLAVPMPPGLSFEAAATNHLAATALHAVRRGEVRLGETWIVAGLGIVGQFCCQLLGVAGVRVLGVDPFPRRCAIAREGGAAAALAPDDPQLSAVAAALSDGYGMDGGIIAFGGDGTPALRLIYERLRQAPDTHRYGRIVVVGGARIEHTLAAALGNVDLRSSARPGPGYHDRAWERGADYPSALVPWTTRRNVELCLRWLAEGRIDAAPILTHRFPLDRVDAACELLLTSPGEAVGVVLVP
mgnify:FL=1